MSIEGQVEIIQEQIGILDKLLAKCEQNHLEATMQKSGLIEQLRDLKVQAERKK